MRMIDTAFEPQKFFFNMKQIKCHQESKNKQLTEYFFIKQRYLLFKNSAFFHNARNIYVRHHDI